MKNVKLYAVLFLLAFAAIQATTAAEARHHHYYGNGFYGNGYGDGCGYHRHHHRRW